MNTSFTNKQMTRRADTLLRAVRSGGITPQSDAMTEIVELTDALRDEPIKPAVVARLTVQRANGVRLIVEVDESSTFNAFYRIYTQIGARRSTKQFLHNQSRGMGLSPIGYHQAGLESVLASIEKYADPANPITKKTIRILKRKLYKRLIQARPDQLGLTQMNRLPIYHRVTERPS